METALSTISVLPATKDEVVRFRKQLKDEILSGTQDVLKIKVQMTLMQRIFDETLKDDDIDEACVNEFQKYSSKEKVVVLGAELRQQETGVKYEYEACGDVKWLDLDAKIKELTEKRKEREKFLQNIPKDEVGIVDPDNGNFITRPPKSSKTKIIVKI